MLKVDINQNHINSKTKIKETATVECTTTKITSNTKEEIKVDSNLNRTMEVTNTKTKEAINRTTIKVVRFTNQETTTSLMDGRLMTRAS
jgi:hypothetical protein